MPPRPRTESVDGLLTEIDLDVFSLYCFTWNKWRESEEEVQKNGGSFPLRTTRRVKEPPLLNCQKIN